MSDVNMDHEDYLEAAGKYSEIDKLEFDLWIDSIINEKDYHADNEQD